MITLSFVSMISPLNFSFDVFFLFRFTMAAFLTRESAVFFKRLKLANALTALSNASKANEISRVEA